MQRHCDPYIGNKAGDRNCFEGALMSDFTDKGLQRSYYI